MKMSGLQQNVYLNKNQDYIKIMELKEALKLAIKTLNEIPNTKVSYGQTYDIIKILEESYNFEEGYYKITSVHKDDLLEKFTKEEIDSLDESDMKRVANKMADAYTENIYWFDLEIITRFILDNKEK